MVTVSELQVAIIIQLPSHKFKLSSAKKKLINAPPVSDSFSIREFLFLGIGAAVQIQQTEVDAELVYKPFACERLWLVSLWSPMVYHFAPL